MDKDLIPWEPDISRADMLTALHTLLSDSVKDMRLIREHQDRLRKKIREIQADPKWSATVSVDPVTDYMKRNRGALEE